MRLAEFIDSRLDAIVREWDAFAATRVPAGAKMDALALRDHAPQILRAIAADLRTPQTAPEQLAKSHGLAPVVVGAPHTAAEVHGTLRAQGGFSISQLVSEYRALRSSVLRLWAQSGGSPELASAAEDVMRFNEAIDQAIAESVDFYSQEVDRGRHLFLGVLGHDLRTPLSAIQMTAHYLSQVRSDEVVSTAARQLMNSGVRMQGLLDDLLDYSRATLQYGISVDPANADLAVICANLVDEALSARPDRKITLEITGEARGIWDAKRLHQALCNLLFNALDHGTAREPIRVCVVGAPQLITVSVANKGVIPPEMLSTIFDPLRRRPAAGDFQPSDVRDSHLGLGLFIAREIVKAHGGEMEVSSTAGETTFSVRLPRQARSSKEELQR